MDGLEELPISNQTCDEMVEEMNNNVRTHKEYSDPSVAIEQKMEDLKRTNPYLHRNLEYLYEHSPIMNRNIHLWAYGQMSFEEMLVYSLTFMHERVVNVTERLEDMVAKDLANE